MLNAECRGNMVHVRLGLFDGHTGFHFFVAVHSSGGPL
jgi:hypothetical protein